MNNRENVENIKLRNLCVSCELCRACCPVEAIEMELVRGQLLPKIDKAKCLKCGLCLNVCPGVLIREDFQNYEENLEKKILGNFINIYSAYTKDDKILNNSTSGGIITSLLTKLLELGRFQGVFVLPFDNLEHRSARLELVKNKEDVFKSSKSKYIPASIYNIVNQIKKEDNPNYVIVGTPCQIKGLKKYIAEKKINDSNLLFLGLFCERTLNFNVINYFNDKYSKKGEKLINIHFKNKEKDGWPGHVKLFFDSKREIIVDMGERIRVKDYFQLERCLYCLDKLNKDSDISCGDCFIGGKERPGRSSVIVRTKKGKEIFDEFSYLFNIEESSEKSLIVSQGLSQKKENLDFLELFRDKSSNFCKIKRKLKKRKRKIFLGENYSFKVISIFLFFNKIKIKLYNLFLLFKDLFKTEFLLFLVLLFRQKKYNKDASKNNIVLLGINFSNRGSQAMAFTAIDSIKRKNPGSNIYLFSDSDFKRDFEEKESYNFLIKPWNNKIKLNLLKNSFWSNRRIVNCLEKDMSNIIANTKYFLDLSGYTLSSSFSNKSFRNFIFSLNYLLPIAIAKRFSIPYYIFPQSVGPFDYPFIYDVNLKFFLKRYLKYPKSIFVREQDGLEKMKKYSLNNVYFKRDVVLSSEEYDLNNIFSKEPIIRDFEILNNSVGIVPNERVYERMNREVFFQLYEKIINGLLALDKNVYILRHSSEDFSVCSELKKIFRKNEKVKLISDDLNCIELEKIISKFDFLVASRYHSIIHAYKKNIPVISIGWAIKYKELLHFFSQEKYLFDFNKDLGESKILDLIQDLSVNRENNSLIIKERMDKIFKEDNIFLKILD